MNDIPATARLLDLAPHPEGGWFRRCYTSPVTVEHPGAAPGAGATRPTATLIHYLLPPGEESAWHTVGSDEVWLWRRGGRLALVTADPGPVPGAEHRQVLGPGIEHGELLQALVPAGHWQRAEPVDDAEVLVSCLVTPGFDFADFTLLEEPPEAR